MAERFGRNIISPLGGKKFYDGSIPEEINYRGPKFMPDSIETAFRCGLIDGVARDFLLAAHKHSPQGILLAKQRAFSEEECAAREEEFSDLGRRAYERLSQVLGKMRMRLSYSDQDSVKMANDTGVSALSLGYRHFPNVACGVLDFSKIDTSKLRGFNLAGGIIAATVRMQATHVVRDLNLVHALIARNIEMNSLQVDGGILAQALEVEGDADFKLSDIKGDLNLQAARIEGTLNLNLVNAGGEVDLTDAQIGILDSRGLTYKCLKLDGAKIGRHVY